MPSFALVLVFVCAYLLGSLSFAVIVSRLMGLHDPRSYGSGNPGATNVLRSGNKVAAVLTLLLDALKGWLAVFVVQQWGVRWGLGTSAVALAGLGAFLGHLYPVFFRFQGGKGVATAAGVLFGFSPWLGLATALVWLLTAVVSRYSSLAALVAALALAPVYWLGGQQGWWLAQPAVMLACLAMAGLLIWRHRQNIQRLLAGQESRLGKKAKDAAQ
ncbi:MAG: glycerol-3-phosphate 1-O-acyltransferase PlsY [Brachymonas sp.]|nr:glycerol-3-phosphate 1-O-acyltransferase PlsY [Brachymonas sp.]